jgi:hypothetical protein
MKYLQTFENYAAEQSLVALYEDRDASAKAFAWKAVTNLEKWENIAKEGVKDKRVSGSSEDIYFEMPEPFTYEFTSDTTNTTYVVGVNAAIRKNLRLIFFGNKNKKKDDFKGFSMMAGIGFNVKGEKEEKTTNLNELFRVMSTVLQCAIDFIEKITNSKDFSLTEFHMMPKLDKEGQKGVDSRRGKLYKAYIKNSVEKLKSKISKNFYVEQKDEGFVLQFGEVRTSDGRVPDRVIAATFEKNIFSLREIFLDLSERLEFHHSDAPDAKGRFRDLGINDLADWLIKTRKGDMRRIVGSLNQQANFNRRKDPKYAEKMDKVREAVKRKLHKEDK